MTPDKDFIITEDGQRLSINDGLITGTEDPGKGLAYETGNVLDEKKSNDEGEDQTCARPGNGDDKKQE